MTAYVSRRELVRGGSVALALGLVACKKTSENDDVSPAEDLMREHGVLERLLVIYMEAARRLDTGNRAVIDDIVVATRIAREFVEDYHERIEERYVFPRFEHARREVELVGVLRRQHDAGRALTDRIIALAGGALDTDGDRETMVAALRGYAKMFAPHVAREDTVLFPRFRALVGKEYAELGDRFEDEERKRFGAGGFERFVAQLPAIEANVGVADLARFTVTDADLDTRG